MASGISGGSKPSTLSHATKHTNPPFRHTHHHPPSSPTSRHPNLPLVPMEYYASHTESDHSEHDHPVNGPPNEFDHTFPHRVSRAFFNNAVYPIVAVVNKVSPYIDLGKDPLRSLANGEGSWDVQRHASRVAQKLEPFLNFLAPRTINGNNGSATNTDDHTRITPSGEPRIELHRRPADTPSVGKIRDDGPTIMPLPRSRGHSVPTPQPPVTKPAPSSTGSRLKTLRPVPKPIAATPPVTTKWSWKQPGHSQPGQSIPPVVAIQTGALRQSQINGNNGSATNTDDHADRNVHNPRPAKKTRPTRYPAGTVAVTTATPLRTTHTQQPITRQQVVSLVIDAMKRVKPNVPREIKEVRSLAARYLTCLKNPALTPPRVGSTGETPTIIVHGFYIATVVIGTVSATQASDFLAYLSPRMFYGASGSNSNNPITYSMSNTPTAAFNAAGSAQLTTAPFLNQQAMLDGLGLLDNAITVPNARMLSGAISLDCRCPGTGTRPYMWAGLLPNQNTISATNPLADPTLQLQAYSSTSIRGFPCTVELPGMTGSARYFPKDAEALEFSPALCATTSSSSTLINSSIPFVGMSGCVAGSTVTITASAFFEVQTRNNTDQRPGFKFGPKCSSNDVYNELKRFPPASNAVQQIGAKVSSGPSTGSHMVMFTPPLPATRTAPLPTVQDKLDKLETLFQRFQLEMYESKHPSLRECPSCHCLTATSSEGPCDDCSDLVDINALSPVVRSPTLVTFTPHVTRRIPSPPTSLGA